MEEITLARAQAAVGGTLEFARSSGLAPLAVVVLDAGGHVLAAAREDGAGHSGIDIAIAKGRGSLSFSMDSRAVGKVFSASPAVCAALSVTLKGQMLPIPGAVLIKSGGGRVLGAIAAAGDAPDRDESAALAGLESARGV